MTTQFLDNIICTFKFYCHGFSHERKKQLFGQFSSQLPHPTPLKHANFIFIVVSQSLSQDVRLDIRPDVRGISHPKTLCLHSSQKLLRN